MLAISGLRVEIAGKTILSGGSAAFKAGSATLLVGTNGAGKTTLLRALAGRLPIADGSIEAGGEPIDAQSAAWKRSRVLLEADGGLLEDFSPAEQLRLRATLLGLDTDEGELRATTLEAAFGFGPHRVFRASKLSTGFRRRLALALAFMSDAKIFLLDEPLNGLDIEGAAAFVHILRSFASAGGTAVIASHIIGPLLQAADALIEIADGRLKRYESTDAFLHGVEGRLETENSENRNRTFPWLAGRQ